MKIQYDAGVEDMVEALSALYQEEKDFKKSNEYSFEALAIAEKDKDEIYKIENFDNIGGNYGEMGRLDSALYYLNLANEGYLKLNIMQGIAFSRINLAEIYVKMKMDKLALEYYRLAIPEIMENGNSEALGEITFYLAGIFKRQNLDDSAIVYAQQSLALASASYFTYRQLQASDLLASIYESKQKLDSTLKYLKLTIVLKDSLFDREKSKTVENLTFNENIRQQEIAAEKRKAEEEGIRNLQLLPIGAFIPLFFLFVLFLSRIKVKARVVEFLGIVGLLLFFEFITDLIYPYISNWTNENPVWEMLVLVIIAGLLERLNFRMERWVKTRLVHKSPHIILAS